MARSPSEEYDRQIPYDPDFNGPRKNRSCTDIICLLLFIVFIGCWVGIAIYAFRNGDPNTLLTPKDSRGSRCGLDYDVKDKPYLFFMDLASCFAPHVPFTGCPTLQICVSKCPDHTYLWDRDQTNGILCNYEIQNNPNADYVNLIKEGQCAKWYLPSKPFKNRCIPSLDGFNEIRDTYNVSVDNFLAGIKNIKALAQAEEVAQKIVEDLVNSWWKILIGIGIAVVTCLIYIVLLRWIAGIMTWISLIGAVALLSFCVYFTAKKYTELKNDPSLQSESTGLSSYLTKKDTWLTLLIITCIVLAVILIIIIFLRKRILLAIALVQEGSKAVGSVTTVLFFPLFPWILQTGLIAFAVLVGLYLSTTGSPIYKVRDMTSECPSTVYQNGMDCNPENFVSPCAQAKCKFVAMNNPAFYPYLQVINAFGFLWGAFFISAFGQMVLATVFATWYWTFKKSSLPFFAVTSAIGQTLRYHIGTLAFGALIIAICRAIRIVLEYIDHQLKKYDNEITKAILCCCKCFFWCLEKFLKFINRNAYIMCAIHGRNFCMSAKDAFSLLMRNIIRVFVLDKVTDFLFFMGKVLITVGIGALSYVIFATDLTSIDNSDLQYNLVPVITIMIFTYLIATLFFNVYAMAVDTLFLCFLEDCERNDGSNQKPYYMSKNLMKLFNKKNKLS